MPEPQLHALREALRELQRGRGERDIADMLGVTRKTWRRIATALGLPPEPVGRRRGSANMIVLTSSEPLEHPTVTATVARFHAERRLDGDRAGHRTPAATLDLLAGRVRDLHDAQHAGEPAAYRDALLAVASAAMLVHAHDHDFRHAG